MHPIVRNILAVVAGLAIGSLVNGGLIAISGHLIPPPEGVDVSTEAGLKAGIHLFEPKHFIFPFLAHALGTLSGAWVAALIAAQRKMLLAMIIGLAFLIGGIMMVQMLSDAPSWFNITDLLLAYLPMAWLGGKLGNHSKRS